MLLRHVTVCLTKSDIYRQSFLLHSAFDVDGEEPEGVILQLAGCAFACVLSRQFRAYESLLKKYRKTRDDSTEWNIVLKEKNKNLLENQIMRSIRRL